MKTVNDEITVGTDHPRTDERKSKGRVDGAKLKPDLVWLRREAGGQWKKMVVDVKVTSTEDLNKAFKEEDEKVSGVGDARNQGEKGRQGGDGYSPHLPRWGGPQ